MHSLEIEHHDMEKSSNQYFQINFMLILKLCLVQERVVFGFGKRGAKVFVVRVAECHGSRVKKWLNVENLGNFNGGKSQCMCFLCVNYLTFCNSVSSRILLHPDQVVALLMAS